MAVGQAEGCAYRVDIHWTPGKSRIRVEVMNSEDFTRYGAYSAVTSEPMPDGTPRDTWLDVLATRVLAPFKLVTAHWVVDPVSLAGEYVKTTGFQWVPEKQAKR